MRRSLSLTDRLALILAGISIFTTLFISEKVFEQLPHLEDEYAYVWEAQAIAGGNAILPSPPVCPKCFLVPFVVDYQGQRFGKYPIAWPVVLAAGVKLGARQWVNPLLTGFSIWLVYLLSKKISGSRTALLAAALTAISPFFLMNSSTLLSHPWALFLCLAFALAWGDLFFPRVILPSGLLILIAGCSLGLLGLTRPLTAVGIALPYFFHGVYIFIKGPGKVRVQVALIGITAGFTASLLLLWQFAATGDPFLNPYTLVWSYDRIGFGPGFGLQKGGNNLDFAWKNTKFSLNSGYYDLFGWLNFSWLFIPFGLVAIRKNLQGWLIALPFFSLVLVYMLYWIGSWLLGPRYYFEGIFSLTILTAIGIAWLAGRPGLLIQTDKYRIVKWARFGIISGLVMFLLACTLLFYLPLRVGGLKGLYGVRRDLLTPFYSPEARKVAPALFIVHYHKSWTEYAPLLDLSGPYFDTPYIFILSRGESQDQAVTVAFPNRSVWHYYPSEPFALYPNPKQ